MGKRFILGLCFMLAFLSVNCSERNRDSDKVRAQHRAARQKLEEQNSEELKQVVDIANKWLELIDKEQYKEAWNSASGLFTIAGKEETWITKIGDGRRLVGTKESRKLLEYYRSDVVLGAPKGDYYNLIFTTSFTKRPSGIEIVFLSRDQDGQWRVAGYIVK